MLLLGVIIQLISTRTKCMYSAEDNKISQIWCAVMSYGALTLVNFSSIPQFYCVDTFDWKICETTGEKPGIFI